MVVIDERSDAFTFMVNLTLLTLLLLVILFILIIIAVIFSVNFTLLFWYIERIDFTILTCPFREFKEVWLLVSIVTESHDSVFPDHCRL